MRIGGIGGTALPAIPRRHAGPPETISRESTGQALIAIESTGATAEPLPRHHSAAFLAHLIATRMQAQQTRERRRAEPEQAVETYQSNSPAKRQAMGQTLLINV